MIHQNLYICKIKIGKIGKEKIFSFDDNFLFFSIYKNRKEELINFDSWEKICFNPEELNLARVFGKHIFLENTEWFNKPKYFEDKVLWLYEFENKFVNG